MDNSLIVNTALKVIMFLKAIAVGGVLRDYLWKLKDELNDLVGSDNEGEIDEGHLYFDWRKLEKRYKLKK